MWLDDGLTWIDDFGNVYDTLVINNDYQLDVDIKIANQWSEPEYRDYRVVGEIYDGYGNLVVTREKMWSLGAQALNSETGFTTFDLSDPSKFSSNKNPYRLVLTLYSSDSFCDRITVPFMISDNIPMSQLSSWSQDPPKVALVVGASYPHGPIPRGSLSDDVVGALSLSGAIKTVNAYLDVEVSHYEETTDEVVWEPITSSYDYIISVGGPFVNMISYKYKKMTWFPVQAITENGHRLSEIMIGMGGVSRCYINQTNSEVVIEYSDGSLETIGTIGNADFIVLEMHYDAKANKYVFVCFGITRYGSVAGARWIADNLDHLLSYFEDSGAAVMAWRDYDGDGIAESNEVNLVVKA